VIGALLTCRLGRQIRSFKITRPINVSPTGAEGRT